MHALLRTAAATALLAGVAAADDAFVIDTATRFVRVSGWAFEISPPFTEDYQTDEVYAPDLGLFEPSLTESASIPFADASGSATQSSEITDTAILASGTTSGSADAICCIVEANGAGASVVDVTFTLTEARAFSYEGVASASGFVGVQTFLLRNGQPVFNLVFSETSGVIDEGGLLEPDSYRFVVRSPIAASATDGPVEVDASFDVAFELSPVLPPSPWTDLGQGLAGAGGASTLEGSGPLTVGSQAGFAITNGAPNAGATLVIGLAEAGLPFKGGTLVPTPTVLVHGLPLDASGDFTVITPWVDPSPSGVSLYVQAWFADAGGPVGFASTNAVRADVP